MTTPRSMVSRIKLKRCEKSDGVKAKTLTKISCKIGDHIVNAYINTGSSISVASTELYRKLVDDECTFKEGKGTLNLINDSIPDQAYRTTTTTVKVIGKTKSINLVAFPDVFIANTTLGMDFLVTDESKKKSNENAVFRVPEIPAPKPKPKPVCSEAVGDLNEPIPLLDWILNTGNLKKPLYNILADRTAEDEDLFAICAFMKRMPRMVSPIRRLENPSNKNATDSSEDRTIIAPPSSVPTISTSVLSTSTITSTISKHITASSITSSKTSILKASPAAAISSTSTIA